MKRRCGVSFDVAAPTSQGANSVVHPGASSPAQHLPETALMSTDPEEAKPEEGCEEANVSCDTPDVLESRGHMQQRHKRVSCMRTAFNL